MKRTLWLVISAVLLTLVLSSWGAAVETPSAFGSGMSTLTTSDLRLPDGSCIQLHTFQATRAGTIVVSMTGAGPSPVTDPFVWVFPGKVLSVADAAQDINLQRFVYDDDSGPGQNALLQRSVAMGEVFTVGFNAFGAGALGTYAWVVNYVATPAAAP